MKVASSKFLTDKKPLLQRLLSGLSEAYPYASILATDSRAKRYFASRHNVGIGEDGHLSARGFVVKVFDGSHYAEYSFNQISEENLPEITAAVRKAVDMSETLLPEGGKRKGLSGPGRREDRLFGEHRV